MQKSADRRNYLYGPQLNHDPPGVRPLPGCDNKYVASLTPNDLFDWIGGQAFFRILDKRVLYSEFAVADAKREEKRIHALEVKDGPDWKDSPSEASDLGDIPITNESRAFSQRKKMVALLYGIYCQQKAATPPLERVFAYRFSYRKGEYGDIGGSNGQGGIAWRYRGEAAGGRAVRPVRRATLQVSP